MRNATGDGETLSSSTNGERPGLRLLRREEALLSRPSTELSPSAGQGQRGRERARAVLGIGDLGFHQEVLDFLEREPGIDVCGTASDPARLTELISKTEPQASVVCPILARECQHPVLQSHAPALIVVTEEMTVPILRDSIEARAQSVFAWPDERDEIAMAIIQAAARDEPEEETRATVIAVLGARGGAGTTFIATHLAAYFASRGLRIVLIDLDTGFSDLPIALGIEAGANVRTVEDLRPVMDELSPEHVEHALYQAPLTALLAPRGGAANHPMPAGVYRAAIALLAGGRDIVVLHAPRGSDPVARLGVDMADEVLLIATPDLFSLYGARRTIDSLHLDRSPDRCKIVLNRAPRWGGGRAEVEGVLAMAPWATVRYDASVHRVQNRGELLPPQARRAGRDLRSLAESLMADRAEVPQAKRGS